ncbi:MAG: Ppx/GppA phosphatase family protein [Sulfuricurvum sp.]|nr:Ppx/GppA phosphatase family protein [Sulfuricurvum sp.]MDD5386226.1 Ppx/GppA phosphatase family protein [Sulfuricurvum sp.]
MAQCTAVIDIGSNSMRMAVFQKTSRFAFHIIHEVKSSVRLAQHAYSNGGNLQPEAMDRGSQAIGEFLRVAQSFKARKILCIATSALREAPNKSDFIRRIQKEHSLSIKVIDGNKEAYLGGIACANLLPKVNAIAIDVGGGSSEFSLLENGNVTQTISLNIGTVRLKELFMDNGDIEGANAYIDTALQSLPFHSIPTLIGIGGTFRAITHGIMKKEAYPLKKLHGFSTSDTAFKSFCDAILDASSKKLRSLNIKPERFDTIKAGALIFLRILNHLRSEELICSGVGVREGVFLSDLLRNSAHKFPNNYNPSVRYLLDTHATHSNHGVECAALFKTLFDATHEHLKLASSWRHELSIAAKLLPIGLGVRYYAYQKHSHYLALSALDYGLTHSQIALISHLLLFKKGFSSSDLLPKNSYGSLLPENKILDTLHCLLWLSHILLAGRILAHHIIVSFSDGELRIQAPHLYLAREQLKNLVIPKNLTITIL